MFVKALDLFNIGDSIFSEIVVLSVFARSISLEASMTSHFIPELLGFAMSALNHLKVALVSVMSVHICFDDISLTEFAFSALFSMLFKVTEFYYLLAALWSPFTIKLNIVH